MIINCDNNKIKEIKLPLNNQRLEILNLNKLLKNLEKLEYLEISDTDIDKGLEYLSDSVEEIGCSIFNRGQCGVKKIKDKLCLFVSFEDDGYFTCKFQPWKMLNKLEEKNKQLEKDLKRKDPFVFLYKIKLMNISKKFYNYKMICGKSIWKINNYKKKLSNLTNPKYINQQSDSIIHQFSAFENQIEEFDDLFQEEEEEEDRIVRLKSSQEIIEN
ncbi:unnamed protein product [Rhizophagus irregularis]|nr:unnamed protein product [Rhizophagus irregularis]